MYQKLNMSATKDLTNCLSDVHVYVQFPRNLADIFKFLKRGFLKNWGSLDLDLGDWQQFVLSVT